MTRLQLLAPPGLVELWALLWRPQGPGGPLEAVAEALCSAGGPASRYEASDLKELVWQERHGPCHTTA